MTYLHQNMLAYLVSQQKVNCVAFNLWPDWLSRSGKRTLCLHHRDIEDNRLKVTEVKKVISHFPTRGSYVFSSELFGLQTSNLVHLTFWVWNKRLVIFWQQPSNSRSLWSKRVSGSVKGLPSVRNPQCAFSIQLHVNCLDQIHTFAVLGNNIWHAKTRTDWHTINDHWVCRHARFATGADTLLF